MYYVKLMEWLFLCNIQTTECKVMLSLRAYIGEKNMLIQVSHCDPRALGLLTY